MFSRSSLSQRPFAATLFVLLSLFIVNTTYATNDVTIDGALGDWNDEVGFLSDAYADTTPARTDITQYGLAVLDNGANPESLALVMVTDTFQGGAATGDSHKIVFYVGPYEIIVDIQNGCDNINGITVLLQATQAVVTAPVTASAVGIINPPFYASSGDTTPDCALELEFPISSLPLLDSDNDGELLDENFVTNFATRQSGGVGNDNDLNDNSGLAPTAVSLHNLTGTETGIVNMVLPAAAIGLLLLTTLFLVARRRA